MSEASPFKKPRLPPPIQAKPKNRCKINYLPNEDDEDDADSVNMENQNIDFASNRAISMADSSNDDDLLEEYFSYSNFDSSIATQAQSQLSQIFAQVGQFTYHPYFVDEEYEDFNGVNQKETQMRQPFRVLGVCQDGPFFHSLKEILMQRQFQLLSKNITESNYHFIQHSVRNVDFLRLFLREYPKLAGQQIEFTSSYLRFASEFFNDICPLYWKRIEIMELFFYPKKESKSFDFLFNLICNSLRLCEKYKEFDLAERNLKIRSKVLFTYQFYKLIMKFLIDDFDQFMKSSDNYSEDIHNIVMDSKPLIIRILWDNKKPDYMSSGFKYFIMLFTKSCKFGIQQISEPLVQLFIRIAESIRICAGNVRPYLAINSTRMAITEELYNFSQKDLPPSQTENWAILHAYTESLSSLSWLQLQMCVSVLKRFVNLNQYFHKGKYKLSLKMLLHTYLAGTLDTFKFQEAERMAQMKKREKILSESSDFISVLEEVDIKPIQEKDEQASNRRTRSKVVPINTTCTGDNQYLNQMNATSLEVLYRKYASFSQRTQFGGNSLHIACRRGDDNWIEYLWDKTDPNLADSQGYTPFNDAARFGHTNCVDAMINMSNKTGLQLDFEAASIIDGATPLHNAIFREDQQAIRLILQNGGRYLLKIPQNSGETPEEMLPESMRETCSIDYKNITIVKPSLENATDAEHYTKVVANSLDSYLNTTKLAIFWNIYQKCMEEAEGLVEIQEEDIRVQLRMSFSSVWGRQPTEEDIDNLMADIKILPEMRSFIDQFIGETVQKFGGNDAEEKAEFHELLMLSFESLMFNLEFQFINVESQETGVFLKMS